MAPALAPAKAPTRAPMAARKSPAPATKTSAPKPARARLLAALLGAALALGISAHIAPARAQERPTQAASSASQGLVSLMANRVQVLGNAVIIAQGDVEIYYEGSRLRASSLRYDKSSESLTIQGPITLTDGNETVILADSAALDTDLRNGIMTSARLVLDQQLQLAAAEIARVEGRYTQLYKTVASSCQTCAANPTPLWQIRAKKVIHDAQTRQLYFENARFEIGGVPVFYLPRLRLPDPTVKRATGFLIPSLIATTQLKTGLKMPYFITLGDHADVTLTPILSPVTTTLGFRYRQMFRRGEIEFNGAASRDSLRSGATRAYLFGSGRFDLGRDYTLSFGLELTSDTAYLLDYGYSSKDRLSNEIALTRIKRDEYLSARLINIRTLRASEIATADQLPFLLGDVLYEQRFAPGAIGGQGAYSLALNGYGRASSTDILGRDGMHIGAGLEWSREWTLPRGVLARINTNLDADFYAISQDSTYDRFQSQITPAISAELRWPLIRQETQHGGVQILEPIAQIAWSGEAGARVPNEDSALVEFDQGNLLSLARFPGSDRKERGLRAALGLSWSRFAPNKARGTQWNAALGIARVFYQEPQTAFTRASGLNGSRSDWLLGASMGLGQETSLMSRNLISDRFGLTKSETRLNWAGEKLNATAAYTYMIADTAENRPLRTSEMRFDGSYRVNRHWTGSLKGRYDFVADRAASAGLGLGYRNECLNVDLSVSRRFTSSSSLVPTTTAALQVSLSGFGGTQDGRDYRRSCAR
ncbi:MAG: LPS-assembly protein LptD [Paracoccaceae bacterium]